MSSALITELAFSSTRKRWTVEEAHRIAGLLPGRYEVIEGELIDKMGQNPSHALVIAVLTELLTNAFPGRIRIQLPIALTGPDSTRSEPEPDVVVLRRNNREFGDRHPCAEDIALLIEVSDTTLQLDRYIKARLYARAGIPEYWIIDIQNRRTLRFRSPSGDEYTSLDILASDVHLTPDAGPIDPPFTLDSLFS